ncbi:MAG: hypothetical protein CVU52_01455 [Deltaproteobacteria bacterium HGW-Deltaproteobacteria-10]|nr:MAG: hypothetical protein CVU52_01455 [Deltaproteobacteria bacterium HGW-Deltaproteobacteria-10]
MKKILLIIFVVAIVAGCLTTQGVSIADERIKISKKEQAKAKRLLSKDGNQNYVTKSFDTTAISLPANYLGHDIVALYNRLAKTFPPKDEFESTEAYKERLEVSYSQDMFAFVIKDNYSVLDASYDADTNNMLVKIGDSMGDKVFEIKLIKDRPKEYVATNKFGAQTIVTEKSGKIYGVCLANFNSFRDTGPQQRYSDKQREITFKLSPEEARGLKNNLASLLVCKVKSSENPTKYSFETDSNARATMSIPIEAHYKNYFVNIELYEIWIFNGKTGVVYAKDIIMPLSIDKDSRI